MKISEFTEPYNLPGNNEGEITANFVRLKKNQLPEKSVVLFGLSKLSGECNHLNKLRESFYQLSNINSKKEFVDIGNIVSLSIEDRKEVLNAISEEAKRKDCVLIMLSSEGDQTHRLILKNEHFQFINICPTVNFNFIESLKDKLTSKFVNVGVQSHFLDSEKARKNRSVAIVSLGNVRDDIREVEPEFRTSNAVNFDLSSIRKSDFSFSYKNSPNGFYAEEICQLAWFGGNSDNINVFSISSVPDSDTFCEKDFMMASQVLWYILFGIGKRYCENPGENTRNFKEYYVENNKIPENIVFYKSLRSEKFWVKYGDDKNMIPCSKKDMSIVLEGNVPDRLVKKIVVSQKKQ